MNKKPSIQTTAKHNRSIHTHGLRMLLLLLLILGLGACGNKGDLYLPEEKTAQTDQAPDESAPNEATIESVH